MKVQMHKKMFAFYIPETGHRRFYDSLGVCKTQGKRMLRYWRNYIFGKPRIEFYHCVEGKRNTLIEVYEGE